LGTAISTKYRFSGMSLAPRCTIVSRQASARDVEAF
jgi:hypothetical protein